jgi:hypothetical protein
MRACLGSTCSMLCIYQHAWIIIFHERKMQTGETPQMTVVCHNWSGAQTELDTKIVLAAVWAESLVHSFFPSVSHYGDMDSLKYWAHIPQWNSWSSKKTSLYAHVFIFQIS